ncbi:MAG: polyprenyl synthetase family protein [Candidatus Omnitrophica bacterium]|nr:polyprenyl synthetase family protein [Candidatus Omnitrophota bacterium]
MTLNEIYRPIQSQLNATESLLIRELSATNGLMGELTRHIARMPGKRIRPALALLGAGLMKRGNDNAVRLAAAVEMIHTATLLHDDVIDGASLRRGLSTLNAKWGDTLSVLSGDYIYSKAFCLLSELNNQKVLRLMSDTARTVCEGEVAQIQHQYDLNLSRSSYLAIIEAKTASLMGASAEAGALLAGATPKQAARLGVFGLNFGLAFQILDDTQDIVGDQEVLGKSLGTDLALGQLTLPLLYLKDTARPQLRSRLAEWFNGPPAAGWRWGWGGNGSRSPAQAEEQLKLLKEEAIRHRVPAYCRRVAARYLDKARGVLKGFPSTVYKRSLLSLADYLVQ